MATSSYPSMHTPRQTDVIETTTYIPFAFALLMLDIVARFSVCMISFFFFQAEDGIRDYKVTGVQTCALPIWRYGHAREGGRVDRFGLRAAARARGARGQDGTPRSRVLVVEARTRATPGRNGEIGRASCRERV